MRYYIVISLVLIYAINGFATESVIVHVDKGILIDNVWVYPSVQNLDEYYYLVQSPKINQTNGTYDFYFAKYISDTNTDLGGIIHFSLNYKISNDQKKEIASKLKKIDPKFNLLGQLPLSIKDGGIKFISQSLTGIAFKASQSKDAMALASGQGVYTYATLLDKKNTTLLWKSLSQNTTDLLVALNLNLTYHGIHDSISVICNLNKNYLNKTISNKNWDIIDLKSRLSLDIKNDQINVKSYINSKHDYHQLIINKITNDLLNKLVIGKVLNDQNKSVYQFKNSLEDVNIEFSFKGSYVKDLPIFTTADLGSFLNQEGINKSDYLKIIKSNDTKINRKILFKLRDAGSIPYSSYFNSVGIKLATKHGRTYVPLYSIIMDGEKASFRSINEFSVPLGADSLYYQVNYSFKGANVRTIDWQLCSHNFVDIKLPFETKEISVEVVTKEENWLDCRKGIIFFYSKLNGVDKPLGRVDLNMKMPYNSIYLLHDKSESIFYEVRWIMKDKIVNLDRKELLDNYVTINKIPL